jgi:hypothetical protein
LHVGPQSFGKLTFHFTFVDLLLTTHNVSDLCAVECGPRKKTSLNVVDVQAHRAGMDEADLLAARSSRGRRRHDPSALTELLAMAASRARA